jgi:hypothetical protein
MSLSQLTDRATRLIATLPASADDLRHQDLDAVLKLDQVARNESMGAIETMKGIIDRNRHRAAPDGYVDLGVRDRAEWEDAKRLLLDADRACVVVIAHSHHPRICQ